MATNEKARPVWSWGLKSEGKKLTELETKVKSKEQAKGNIQRGTIWKEENEKKFS